MRWRTSLQVMLKTSAATEAGGSVAGGSDETAALFVVRRSSFVFRRSSFVVRRSSIVVRRSSFVVRRSQLCNDSPQTNERTNE